MDGFIGVSLADLFNFCVTLINLSQTQRIDEIDTALIKCLSGYLPRYQLSYVRARVLIPSVAGPVRSL